MDKLTRSLGYTPRKIAIFRALKLGDLLCSVPVFRALRQAFPDAHIALISLPWAAEFVAAYGQYLDEHISFPGWPGLPEQPVNPTESVAFLQQMQYRQWDVIFQLQGNGTLVNAMLSLVSPQLLVGYYLPELPAERWAGLDGLMHPYPANTHEILRHVGLLNGLGIAVEDRSLTISLSETDRQQAHRLLHQAGIGRKPYVCLHVGGISGRRWPEQHFAEVADALANRHFAVVLTGTNSEQALINTVSSIMTHQAISVAGQTSLRSLGALLEGAALLISNDTGVAHLAVACQTPSVVIFTSANPAEWGPLDQKQHCVVAGDKPDSTEQVLKEAYYLLSPEQAATSSVSMDTEIQPSNAVFST